MIASDHQSIFGDTSQGVPNPQVPAQHPWPTRYHGPIFTTPRFGMPFVATPYASAPYSGLGAPAALKPMGQVAGAIRIVAAGAVVGLAAGLIYAGSKKGASNESVGKVAGTASGVLVSAVAVYGAYWLLAQIGNMFEGQTAPKN